MIAVGLLLGTLLTAPSGAGQGTIVLRAEAAVSGRTVVFGQVADLSALPPALRTRAETLEVARLPAGRTKVTLDGDRIAERARAQLPALGPWMSAALTGTITLYASPAAPPALSSGGGERCARVQQAVQDGEFLLSADLAPAACDDTLIRAAVRLDPAAGAVQARRDLAIGDLILAPPPASLARARPGQALRLSTVVGPVAVEREVVLARPVRAGSPAFVKGGDGPVFVAPPLQEATP
jgi:hypothetical protein